MSILNSNHPVGSNLVYERSKRIFDLSCACLGVVALGPSMLAISALIKITSPGPVLYLGKRTGYQHQPFYIYKFRTMIPGAEALGTTTAQGDPRISKVGRLLRRFKLDELPQLFNVIKGNMSLVGPRPEVEEHTDVYTEEEQAILTVLPGITDYSSIAFFHLDRVLGSENPHEIYVTKIRAVKNQLRLKYVRNRSFTEDLRIIMITILRLLRLRKPTPIGDL